MRLFLIILAIILTPSLLASIKIALIEKSWTRLAKATLLFATGISLPLLTFFLSAYLLPDWKGESPCGWLGCFHLGKLTLTPFILWACAAFYTVQVSHPNAPAPKWAVMGLLAGAIISSICFIIGLFILDVVYSEWAGGMVIPLYTAIWYSVLFFRHFKHAELSKRDYMPPLIGMIPFWVASLLISYKHHLSLPDNPPDCFVVTAASRGHAGLVGPFIEIDRRGAPRTVNQQLIVFWQLEKHWQQIDPKSHQRFRKFYNRVGPGVAKRMRNAFIADAVYIFLKPAELIARLAIKTFKSKDGHYGIY